MSGRLLRRELCTVSVERSARDVNSGLLGNVRGDRNLRQSIDDRRGSVRCPAVGRLTALGPIPGAGGLPRLALLRAGLTLACGLMMPGAPALAIDYDLSIDLRAQVADATPSFLRGQLGKLRSDDAASLATSRLRLGLAQPLGEAWRAVADITISADDPDAFGDLTEAYFEYRPYPQAGWRTRVKLGAFYAPISLENRAAGWETPYSLSSSALNAWIGEELRTVGAELQLDWLGTRMGSDFDAGLVVGLYGWNDFAGAFLAARGFRVQDRQTAVFGEVAQPGVKAYSLEPFLESDDRPGYYVGARVNYAGRLELRALHYDNRGDPTVFVARVADYIWQTRFDAIGLRLETANGWTVIAQRMAGSTAIEPGGTRLRWDYDASFLLVSRELGGRQSPAGCRACASSAASGSSVPYIRRAIASRRCSRDSPTGSDDATIVLAVANMPAAIRIRPTGVSDA